MSERDGWNHLYLYDGAHRRGEEPDHEGRRGSCAAWAGRRAGAADLVQRERHERRARIRTSSTTTASTSTAPASTPLTDGRRQPHRRVLARRQVLRRHLLARRPAAGVTSCDARATDASLARARDAATSPRCSRPAGRRRRPFVAKGRDGTTDIYGVDLHARRNFDPDAEVPGDREHLRRAARLVRAQDVRRLQPACRRSPSSASSSCRSTAWAPRTARRRSTTSPGRTSGTPASPTASSGIKAVAAKYPWYDITRVGIYGTSAGGQNALGGLLFHPEFYKVAVSRRRVPRQPDGQDLVERAVDGLADRPAVRGVVEHRQRRQAARASCC